MAFCCITPLLVAKSLSENNVVASLSMGSKGADWPFSGLIDLVKGFGHGHIEVGMNEYSHDKENKILCTPCYMCLKSTPYTVYSAIDSMIGELNEKYLKHNFRKIRYNITDII